MGTTRWGLAAALASFAACAPLGGPAGAPGPDVGGVEVRVENGMPVNLRVLALYGGSETPLGRVDALAGRSLRLPYGTGTIRLVARPAAGFMTAARRHVSEPVVVVPGQRITWQLRASPGTSDLPKLSTIRVFACEPPAC